MDNLAFDLEELFVEAKEKATAEGAFEREQWDQIIEELLEDKRQFQEMDDDEDLVSIKESLQARFDDFLAESGEM